MPSDFDSTVTCMNAIPQTGRTAAALAHRTNCEIEEIDGYRTFGMQYLDPAKQNGTGGAHVTRARRRMLQKASCVADDVRVT